MSLCNTACQNTSKYSITHYMHQNSIKLHLLFIKKETKGYNEVGAKTFLNMKKALGRGKHQEQF